MGSTEEAAAADMCCAFCGQAEIDDVKLKECGDCDLVKYCSDECQGNHREQHDEECKERAAELRDDDLFAMPDGSHRGECPICCLPLPMDLQKSTLSLCCSKTICNGCNYANQKREFEAGLEHRCAFCREPLAKTEEESENKRFMKRVKKNCPVAMREMGRKCYSEGKYKTAFNYWIKAAELGDADAHFNLSGLYDKGRGVEKDKKKEVYHLEEAAIAGHPKARLYLGMHEGMNGRFERARRHFIIGANLACEDSLQGLKALYADGNASKEDYASALRGYQAALEATKSEERVKAEVRIS